MGGLLLFLQETVNLEPIGSSAVSGAGLGHANREALAQAARFTRGPIFLVDNTLAIVLAICDSCQVVVRSPEE